MDKSKPPGITIRNVTLLECHVADVDPSVETPVMALALTEMDRSISDDERSMMFLAGFDVMHGVKTRACTFTCKFAVEYARPAEANMTWEEFNDPIALAHIIPYLREFVTNITTRLPLPILRLPPINTHYLIGQFRERQKTKKKRSVPRTKAPSKKTRQKTA